MSAFTPRIRPASDFEIKPRRSLLARFLGFWTHPTIAEMQAQMLREVWDEYRLRRLFPISYSMIAKSNRDKTPIELFKAGILTPTELKTLAERGELHVSQQ